jgi:hypothetical protein
MEKNKIKKMKKNFSAHTERTDLINMSSEKKLLSRETVPLNEEKAATPSLQSLFLSIYRPLMVSRSPIRKDDLLSCSFLEFSPSVYVISYLTKETAVHLSFWLYSLSWANRRQFGIFDKEFIDCRSSVVD